MNTAEKASREGIRCISDDEALDQLITGPGAFDRIDESDDREFYARPRLTEHLDVTARKKISEIIDGLVVEKEPQVLDLMAAVSSHMPQDKKLSKLTGLGLNEEELKANKELDEYIIHDLNKESRLPFDNDSFDVVLNTASVQYIKEPFRLFAEVGRVLKPGGLFLVLFSNRSFPTKAVKLWELLTEEERIKLVMNYFRRCDLFETPVTYISMGQPRPRNDKYIELGIPSDPVFAVFAEKKNGQGGRPKRTLPGDTVQRASLDELSLRKSQVADTMQCPYCRENLYKWKITENPWSTWDHDLYICINDDCPYVVNGWREMYRQGNFGISYRLVYDKTKDSFLTIPVPNLNVIKDSLEKQK